MFSPNSNEFSQVGDPYLNFPSHMLDNDELFLGTVLPYQTPPPPPPPRPPRPPLPPLQPPTTTETTTNNHIDEQIRALEKGKRKQAVGRPIRRTGKKDRHSKINTAHGPRDRRMRLSLQIARRFFDLQDMLGFDKASKTIEWLFNKSKAAIKDLAERSCTSMLPSSPSEDTNYNYDCDYNNDYGNNNNNSQLGRDKGVLSQMKENREKARARARERTKEKLMKNKQPNPNLEMEQNPNLEMENNNNNVIRADQELLEDQMASVGIIEKFLTTSIFDFHHHDTDHRDRDYDLSRVVSCDPLIRSNDDIGFVGFPGNWVTENARISAGFEAHVSSNIAGVFMGRPFNQGN